MKVVAGLGNPGKEYEGHRHNAGRIVVSTVAKKLADENIKFITPDDFMNNSGKLVSFYVKKPKDVKGLIVVYDDIDLPLGTIKISFDKSSGGHNGLESVIKHLKTREFLRIRVGIAPVTPSGKIRKPKGEKAVLKFLLSDFKKEELDIIKKMAKKVALAITTIYNEGAPKAMSLYN